MTNRGLNDEWPVDAAVEVDAGGDIAPRVALVGRPNGIVDLDGAGDAVPVPWGVDTTAPDDLLALDGADQIVPKEA